MGLYKFSFESCQFLDRVGGYFRRGEFDICGGGPEQQQCTVGNFGPPNCIGSLVLVLIHRGGSSSSSFGFVAVPILIIRYRTGSRTVHFPFFLPVLALDFLVFFRRIVFVFVLTTITIVVNFFTLREYDRLLYDFLCLYVIEY